MALEAKETLYQPALNLVGASSRTLPLSQREELTRLSSDAKGFLAQLVERCALKEAALLSTCNRFEIISAGNGREQEVVLQLERRLGHALGAGNFYRLRNSEAVRHFFRVASSLDSMVIGEPQILGQVKESYLNSVSCGFAGPCLHRLFQMAFRVAKKVRSDTAVGQRGVSLSYVAVKLAQQVFGSLASRSALLIGSGEMAELAALHLRAYGCSEIIVANRTISKASELADRIGGAALALDDIKPHLGSVDVVLGSLAIDRPIIEFQFLKNLRRRRALLLIDLGVPRNFSPALAALDGVYLYNIDDLGRIAAENRALRQEAAKDAEVIIDHGLLQFERWLLKSAADPAIRNLRSSIEVICSAEVREALKGELDAQALLAVSARLSHRISQKISHGLTRLLAQSPQGKLDLEALIPFITADPDEGEA